MLPLPPAINTMVAMPLQRIATVGSCFVLQLTGLWVVPAGNVITLSTPHGPQQLEVALACNGLSMLMTLAATVTATVILIPMPTWKRLAVLASAVPIALVSNIARIVATGWLYYLLEGELAHERAHDWSGYLMMPLALVLVGSELWLLSWLFDDEQAKAAARPISPVPAPRRA
jgi:exosortase